MHSTVDDSMWTTCPYCGHWDLHYIREPNLEPPILIVSAEEQERNEFRVWGGQSVMVIETKDEYDRDDERDFCLIRICTRQKCDKAWGVIASPEKE